MVPIRTRPVSSQPNYQTKSSKPMNSTQSQTSYKSKVRVTKVKYVLCLRQAPTPTTDTNNRHPYDGGGRDDDNNDQRPTNNDTTTNEQRQTTNDKRPTNNEQRRRRRRRRQRQRPTATLTSHPLTHTHTHTLLVNPANLRTGYSISVLKVLSISV